MANQIFIDASYNEINNHNADHIYYIKNMTKGIILNCFIRSDFSIRSYYENQRGIQNPDSMTFQLEFGRYKQIKTDSIPFPELPYDSPVIQGVLYDGIYSTVAFDDDSVIIEDVVLNNYTDVIEEGDTIEIINVFSTATQILFQGEVTSLSKQSTNMMKYFNIKIEDITYKGFDDKFLKQEVYVGSDADPLYIYNSSNKDRSLLYIYAKKLYNLDNIDHLIDFQEIKYPNGVYRELSFVKAEKNDKIYTHIANLVDSFGGKIYMNEGLLTIRNPLGQSYSNSYEDLSSYTISGDMILKEFYEEPIKPEYNQVNIKYDKYFIADRQRILLLRNQEGTDGIDNAGLKIDPTVPGTNNVWYEFNFISDYCVEIESPETEAYTFVGQTQTPVNLTEGEHYEIEYDSGQGRVRFFNSTSEIIYIDKFVMYGKPVKVLKDIELEWSEEIIVGSDEKNLEITGNQYIQDDYDAEILSKWLFHEKCKEKIEFKFNMNVAHFLRPNTKVTINHPDFSGEVLINELEYSLRKTQIASCKKFEDFSIPSGIVNIYEKNQSNNTLDGLQFLHDNGIIFNENKPDTVQNLQLTPYFMAIEAEWDEITDREDISGYIVGIQYTLQGGGLSTEVIKFTSKNKLYFASEINTTYFVRVKALTIKGLEGDYSASVGTTPILSASMVSESELQDNDERVIATFISANAIQTGVLSTVDLNVQNNNNAMRVVNQGLIDDEGYDPESYMLLNVPLAEQITDGSVQWQVNSVNNANGYIKVSDSGVDIEAVNFLVNAKTAEIKNVNNRFYFDPTGVNSQFLLDVDYTNTAIYPSGVSSKWQVGNIDGKYISYDGAYMIGNFDMKFDSGVTLTTYTVGNENGFNFNSDIFEFRAFANSIVAKTVLNNKNGKLFSIAQFSDSSFFAGDTIMNYDVFSDATIYNFFISETFAGTPRDGAVKRVGNTAQIYLNGAWVIFASG